ncbi:Gfo/Idh/MocA family oxidoreductase [Phytoactinopolyspora alkaliphila]|uniref:Gfo/Idh/MocA family oxidoreductase n=1 Tax=Phytoactinopolyspora alkaliphila TaxID=1783498 RepID=A0A6N9YLZ5_9ACTN|nr:Gfo/Idh/MocA family oxidoreductase [Phytoactinopolyspora alkaliphila]NED95869.1 Gfo/Idh/MocA family oxidoreductase [Phytoactinopolyspora alkaliphila]
MSPAPLKVGVVGLGEVAQVVHLPILSSRPDLFEIAAVCDVSPNLVSLLGERYGVPGRYIDADSFMAHDLDAVMVLTSDEYHTDLVIAACRAGKHVFVEKPICLNLRDGEAILKERNNAGVQVMVGYMRRYAPAFLQAVDEVRSWDAVNHASLRDIIGQNRLLIDQSSVVARFDVPAEVAADRDRRAREQVAEAIGDVPSDLVRAYRMLCGLAIHDISAMREILGSPVSVRAAAQWSGGGFMSILFDYGTYCASLDVGVDLQKRFDCHIEVGSELKTIKVQYDTPYIRHLPTTLHVAETDAEAHSQMIVRPTFKDAYVFELETFHEVASSGLQPKTDIEDSLRDLELFQHVVAAFQR